MKSLNINHNLKDSQIPIHLQLGLLINISKLKEDQSLQKLMTAIKKWKALPRPFIRKVQIS